MTQYLKIEIELDNALPLTVERQTVARILGEYATRLADGKTNFNTHLYDDRARHVGQAWVAHPTWRNA